MDFDLSDEQRALAETLDRFVARDYDFAARRAILSSPAGWSRDTWRKLADLGVLGLAIPETHGGLGYGTVEMALVMNAMGRALVVEPYLPAAVVAPEMICRAAGADFQAEWLPRIATGDAIVIPVDADGLTIERGRVTGRLDAVRHAASADLLLLAKGDSLHAVTPDASGLSLSDEPMLDGQRAADLAFDHVPATTVGSGNTEIAWDVGLAALCGEAVGILDATLAATGDYLRTRHQFGQPIGRFQALQHRMADMLLQVEQARSMCWLAALRCRESDSAQRRRVLSAAKVIIGDACRFVGKNAVQLHGGMGMTDELVVSHWFKRLAAIELTWGDTDQHLQRFIRLGREPASAC